MSRPGMIAAAELAKTLPAFQSLAEAEAQLYAFRDERLSLVGKLSEASSDFQPTYQPDSLKALERWWFDLAESDGFARLGVQPETFEECIGMYLLETAVRHSDVEWAVREYAFGPGLYEIGVTRPLFTVFCRRLRPRAIEDRNKRKQSLWRQYQDWFKPPV
jgi:hypothetical protein